MNLAGYDDWRLPNIREIQSIMVVFGPANPTLDPVFGEMSGADCTWSSTSHIDSPERAWYVLSGTIESRLKRSVAFVRAVRGGR